MQYQYHIETFDHMNGRWEKLEEVADVPTGFKRLDALDRENTCAALIRIEPDGRMPVGFNREATIWGKRYDRQAAAI